MNTVLKSMWKRWVPVHTWSDLSRNALRPTWYGDRSILLGRNRAYLNRCPHRGSRLVSEDGPAITSPLLVCPYHGMSFKAATGQLHKAPRWPTCPPLALDRLAVERYGPFAMVNADSDAEFGGQDPVPLEQQTREKAMVVRAHEEIRVDAPVTILMENFLDTYHVPCIHKTLARSSHIERHRELQVDQYGWHFSTILETPSPMVRGSCPIAYYTGVWPSAFAFRLETHVFAVVLRPSPNAEHTIETATLLAPPAWSDAEVDETMEFYRNVNNEDIEACSRVARGRRDTLSSSLPDVYHPDFETYSADYVHRVVKLS